MFCKAPASPSAVQVPSCRDHHLRPRANPLDRGDIGCHRRAGFAGTRMEPRWAVPRISKPRRLALPPKTNPIGEGRRRRLPNAHLPSHPRRLPLIRKEETPEAQHWWVLASTTPFSFCLSALHPGGESSSMIVICPVYLTAFRTVDLLESALSKKGCCCRDSLPPALLISSVAVLHPRLPAVTTFPIFLTLHPQQAIPFLC